MRRQILNQDGTLNIYIVTVSGTVNGETITEWFPFTLQVDKTNAHGEARGMWQALRDPNRTCTDLQSKIDEHEVLGVEISTADRIRNGEDEIRNAVNQHFDSANGDHYSEINAHIHPAITRLVEMVERQ